MCSNSLRYLNMNNYAKHNLKNTVFRMRYKRETRVMNIFVFILYALNNQ